MDTPMATVAHPLVPLESGDRLSRAQFHRRYCARPDIKRAELVEGVVYVASPLRYDRHSRQHRQAIVWLDAFASRTPDLELAIEATVILGEKSEVQPDVCLFRPSAQRLRLREDGYLEGAPDLVFEVAASSASYDLHDKLEAYRQAGVPEYIVWRTVDRAIDWFDLVDGRYVRREPDARGIIESRTFPGLRLNVAAMLAEDRAAMLAALEPTA
jgi:Uma2 family endonuclease